MTFEKMCAVVWFAIGLMLLAIFWGGIFGKPVYVVVDGVQHTFMIGPKAK